MSHHTPLKLCRASKGHNRMILLKLFLLVAKKKYNMAWMALRLNKYTYKFMDTYTYMYMCIWIYSLKKYIEKNICWHPTLFDWFYIQDSTVQSENNIKKKVLLKRKGGCLKRLCHGSYEQF